eukprot:TRINITY_DN87988_c0_g1_i2.p1 TRINITY_DN87988_c0_g1~~TRINITY_DN87988_c0_g1_i2.p1  ORF type:complete len:156 (+),score=8.09 TRINITY_DN87988_c0_g1_i2:36-470(+)
MSFYLSYLLRWPECCWVAEGQDGSIAGYIIGKVEGLEESWHGHVTALSVSPAYRKMHVAQQLMDRLEEVCDDRHQCLFMDLYVRPSNVAAVSFYRKLGYVVYQNVERYYNGSEDAFDMRRTLSNDPDGLSTRGAYDDPFLTAVA